MLTALTQGVEEVQNRSGVDGQLSPYRVSLTSAGARLDLGWGEDLPTAYLAPEQQLSPPRTGPASDVYALAALTLFALTGEVPPTAGQRGLGQPLPVLPVGLPYPLRQANKRGLVLNSTERLPNAASLLRLLSSTDRSSSPGAQAAASAQPKVRIVQAHQSWLTHLASDDQRIVTAGADLRLRVFDLQGQPLQHFDGLQGKPTGLVVGEFGIVTSDDAGALLAWRDGNTRPQVQAGRWRMSHLVVQRGSRAATLQDDGALGGVWDLNNLHQEEQAPFPIGRFTTLHAVSDGTLPLGTSDGQVQVFDEAAMLPMALWQHPDRRGVTQITSPPMNANQCAVVVGQTVTVLD